MRIVLPSKKIEQYSYSMSKALKQTPKIDCLTWTEIKSLVERLADLVQVEGIYFDSISTITRGGLIPSRLLADRLGIKRILVDKEKIPLHSLFVDDIYDSGKTFEKILPKVENPNTFVFAVLVARRKKKYPRQLIYIKQTKGDETIVFPWDRFEYGIK